MHIQEQAETPMQHFSIDEFIVGPAKEIDKLAQVNWNLLSSRSNADYQDFVRCVRVGPNEIKLETVLHEEIIGLMKGGG